MKVLQKRFLIYSQKNFMFLKFAACNSEMINMTMFDVVPSLSKSSSCNHKGEEPLMVPS